MVYGAGLRKTVDSDIVRRTSVRGSLWGFSWMPLHDLALQFRVWLWGINPPIWRRIVLSPDLNFAELHEVLQACFGWQNSHMHQFTVGGLILGAPEFEDGGLGQRRVLLPFAILISTGSRTPISCMSTTSAMAGFINWTSRPTSGWITPRRKRISWMANEVDHPKTAGVLTHMMNLLHP